MVVTEGVRVTDDDCDCVGLIEGGHTTTKLFTPHEFWHPDGVAEMKPHSSHPSINCITVPSGYELNGAVSIDAFTDTVLQ